MASVTRDTAWVTRRRAVRAGVTTATLYTVRQGAAWITLNRPEQRNALSAALVNELHAHLQAALADDAVRAIVLTGAGKAFCAGADLNWMRAMAGYSWDENRADAARLAEML